MRDIMGGRENAKAGHLMMWGKYRRRLSSRDAAPGDEKMVRWRREGMSQSERTHFKKE